MKSTTVNNKEQHCISCCWSAYNITVIFLSMKHLRVLENIFKCVPVFQMELEFGSVGF